MVKLKKIFNEYGLLFVLLVLGSTLIFGRFIFWDNPFNIFGDQVVQYNIFYDEWKHLLLDFINGKGLPFYSWNMFLGTDFYSSQSIVVCFDVFLIFVFLFESIDGYLLFQSFTLIILSGLLFNILLNKIKIRNHSLRIVLSLIYAFSGWSIMLIGTYMWHRFFTFLPLLLIGVHSYKNDKKIHILVLSSFLLFLTNYYLMFPTCFFILLYSTCILVEDKYNLMSMVAFNIKMIFLMCCGFMMTAALMLPSIISLLSNPRVGSISFDNLFWDFNVNIGFLLQSGIGQYHTYPNAFAGLENFADSAYTLFIGMLPLCMLITILMLKKYRVYLYAITLIIMVWFIKPLNSIIMGFSEPTLRWGFLIIIFALVILAKGFNDLDEKKLKHVLIKYNLLMFIIIIISVFLNVIKIDKQFFSILLQLILGIIISCIYFRSNKLSFVFILLQLVCYGAFIIYYQSREYNNYEETIVRELVDDFQMSDTDLMYRYYVDHKHLLPSHDLNLNKSLDYGFMGVDSYNTFYDTNIQEFLWLNDIHYHHFDLNDPNIMPMLGVKYYIVYDEKELPEELKFEYAYNLNHLKVYKVIEYSGFSRTMDSIDYFKNITSTNLMLNTLFVENDVDINKYQNIEAKALNIYEKGNNFIKGDITLNSDNILIIPIPNNKGWKILVNGVETKPISVNGGFIGVELCDGYSNLELYFTPYGLREGIIISVCSSIAFAIIIVINKIKRGVLNEH